MRKNIQKINGRSTSSKSIVITGDMHVGHKYAVHTGEYHRISEKLKPIKEFWFSAKDKLQNKQSNVFFINGEHIDGDNRKEGGHQVWSTDLNDQFADARHLLKGFSFKSIGMNRGSNYHTTKDNTGFEEMFLNSLRSLGSRIIEYSPFGSLYTPDYDENRNETVRVDDLSVYEINGKIFHIMHHVGGSKWFSYLPTALGREMANMVFFNEKLWETKDAPSVIVRSHTHRYVQIKFSTQAGVVTPCWKIFDRFSTKNGQDAGTIGLVEFIVESNGKLLINDIILENKSYPKLNIVHIE